MTSLRRSSATLAALALSVAAAVVLAPPAHAGPPTITFVSPKEANQTIAEPRIVADVEASPNSLTGTRRLVGKILVEVVSPDDASRKAVAEVGANGGSSQRVIVLLPLPFNGRYEAKITATDDHGALGGDTSTKESEFFLAAPPAPPKGLKAVIDIATRAVTLSWEPNAEPDLLYYLVLRARGDGAFEPLGKVDKAPEPSFVDPSTAEAGGEYRYQVVAVRLGATAAEDKRVPSEPALAAIAVPDLAGPGTTIVPGGPAGPGGNPATTVAGGRPGARSPGQVNPSDFAALRNRVTRPAPRAQAPPDTGFTETLPFQGEGQGGDESEAELGEDQATSGEQRELGVEDQTSDRTRSLAFLAGGLLATVLLGHVLWVRGQVYREPLEPVVPESGDGSLDDDRRSTLVRR